jgi:type II secretory pathway component GspD/PulD (secretin)
MASSTSFTRRMLPLGVVAIAILGSPRARADGPAPAAPAPGAPPAAAPAAPPVPAAGPAATPPAVPAKPPEPPTTSFPGEGRIQKADGKSLYFYRTNFVKPAALVTTMKNLLDLPGIVLKDFPLQNQVLVEGTPDAIETALEAFAYFDIPTPQVFVEAKIIEVTYENNFEFGFSTILDRDKAGPNTFFRGDSVTLNPPSFFQSQQPGNLPFQGASLAFGFVGEAAKEFGAMDLTLQALQRDGTAEVLSKPSIIATEGLAAEVKTAQRTPVIQIKSATSNSLSGDGLLLDTSYVETKIGLKVTASHIGDGYVTMLVEPTVSGITGFSAGQGGTSAPIISDRSATTTVTMADGDTLVIGGLYTNSTVSDKAKVPFLGDIPGLGKLFTRVKDQKVKTELVFFITPHILRKNSDQKVITPPGEAERLRDGGGCRVPEAPDGPGASGKSQFPLPIPTLR